MYTLRQKHKIKGSHYHGIYPSITGNLQDAQTLIPQTPRKHFPEDIHSSISRFYFHILPYFFTQNMKTTWNIYCCIICWNISVNEIFPSHMNSLRQLSEPNCHKFLIHMYPEGSYDINNPFPPNAGCNRNFFVLSRCDVLKSKNGVSPHYTIDLSKAVYF